MIQELLEYAKAELRLGRKQKDGATLRQHLMMAYHSSGVMPGELRDAPELPQNARHVWMWFMELNRARPSSGFGASAISFMEIESWARLTHTLIEPWEIRALCLLDETFLNEMRKEAK